MVARGRMRRGRMVGLSQFSDGLTPRRSGTKQTSRAKGWLWAAAPAVVVAVWVVARVARH